MKTEVLFIKCLTRCIFQFNDTFDSIEMYLMMFSLNNVVCRETYLLCNAQKFPLPGRSIRRGILIKQSLNDKLCLNEFCHL